VIRYALNVNKWKHVARQRSALPDPLETPDGIILADLEGKILLM